MQQGKMQDTVYRNFMLILLAGALLLAAIMAGGYTLEMREFMDRAKVLEKHNVDLQKEMIFRTFDVIRADLLFLARQNELIQLLETNDGAYLKMITEEYTEFSRQRGIYDQVRFIDGEGMEVCRVNYEGGTPVAVPKANLQAKKKRYYFKDSLALKRWEVFVSPLDLNIEQGRIELPLKPMIRFGSPVYDLSGGKRGIVVLNYLGSNLLRDLDEISRFSQGKILLADSRGYWLKGLTPEDEWGFMFEDRRDRRFDSRFPSVWEGVGGRENFQAETKAGLFTSATIRLLDTESHLSTESPDGMGKNRATPDTADYHWKLVSYVPASVFRKEARMILLKLLGMAGVLFAASILPAFLLAQARSRQERDRKALIQMANFDKLTGLANRSLFLDRLEQAVKRAKRYDGRCALFFIDLDGFKAINDNLGHEAGDAVLIETGKRLNAAVRESDLVARHGGDEFTVILPMVKMDSDAETVATKILDAMAGPFLVAGKEPVIGASIGIGIFPEAGQTVNELLNNADTAMYEAKAKGKNRWVLYKSG